MALKRQPIQQPRVHPEANSKGFLAKQAIVILFLCGLGAAHFRDTHPVRRIPVFQNEPRRILSQHNMPTVITDVQLGAVLHKLRPQLNHPQPKVNFVDHALRMWGDKVQFEDESCLSGPEMRGLLVNHDAFVKRWGKKTRPLIIHDEKGIGWRTQQGAAAISHVDHSLATLAEIGLKLDDQVRTAGGDVVVEDLLESAVARFRLNQAEYEWTALACALYAENLDGWVTEEGQVMELDLIARRIIRERPNKGVCYGNHRLFTLAMLLRIDEETEWFSPKGRAAVMSHLREMTACLIQTQSTEGYWDSNWPNLAQPVDEKQQPRARRLLATGHALEWWAMAPEELLPPRETIVRAAQWLVREVDSLEPADVTANYTFLTHVGRALALWRGGDVGELYARCYHGDSAAEARRGNPTGGSDASLY